MLMVFFTIEKDKNNAKSLLMTAPSPEASGEGVWGWVLKRRNHIFLFLYVFSPLSLFF